MLQFVELPPVAGEAEGVRVTLTGLPALACPEPGHDRRPPFDGIDEAIVEYLFDYEETVPVAYEEGLFRRRLSCTRCRHALDGSRNEPGRVEATVELPDLRETRDLPDLPPITVAFEAPVLTCPACSTTQLVDDKVGPAMLDAFIQLGWRRNRFR